MEVLDPGNPKNFLPPSQLGEIACMVLDSPAVKLGYENKWQAWEASFRSLGNDSPAFLGGARWLVFNLVVGEAAIPKILADDKARSEHHIAGEICRVHYIMQHMLEAGYPSEIQRPSDLHYLENLAANKYQSIWIPGGSNFACPTIDGNPVDNSITPKSFHQIWLNHISARMKILVSLHLLQEINPPFIFTDSHEIIADTHIKYYANPQINPIERDFVPDLGPSPLLPELQPA